MLRAGNQRRGSLDLCLCFGPADARRTVFP